MDKQLKVLRSTQFSQLGKADKMERKNQMFTGH